MIRRAIYFFSKARESMQRTPLLSMATIGMLAVVFLLFNSFALIATNVSGMAERWIGSVRMTAFLADSATPEDAQRLATQFRQKPEITGAFYVSREEATGRFLGHFPGNRSILDGLPENPLPASLELKLAPEAMQIERLETLATELETDEAVEEALYGRELFSKLSTLVGLVRLVGGLLGLALMVAVLFLTANTIRLNLYARREEIEILQLVGATRWFIRWPYLIEGAVQGFAGAALSVLATLGMFHLALNSLKDVLAGPLGQMELAFLAPSFILGVVGVGTALGAIGSFLAIGRFWRTS